LSGRCQGYVPVRQSVTRTTLSQRGRTNRRLGGLDGRGTFADAVFGRLWVGGLPGGTDRHTAGRDPLVAAIPPLNPSRGTFDPPGRGAPRGSAPEPAPRAASAGGPSPGGALWWTHDPGFVLPRRISTTHQADAQPITIGPWRPPPRSAQPAGPPCDGPPVRPTELLSGGGTRAAGTAAAHRAEAGSRWRSSARSDSRQAEPTGQRTVQPMEQEAVRPGSESAGAVRAGGWAGVAVGDR
jgi:hypothetical protein